MFELARGYRETGMTAYCGLQEKEFSLEAECGYQAVKHQRFVGTGYFDQVAQAIAGGLASTTALNGSTEQEQFAESKERRNRSYEAAEACEPVLREFPTPAVTEIMQTREEMLPPAGD